MSQYYENGYFESGYYDGDVPTNSENLNCDLSPVITRLNNIHTSINLFSNKLVDIDTKIDTNLSILVNLINSIDTKIETNFESNRLKVNELLLNVVGLTDIKNSQIPSLINLVHQVKNEAMNVDTLRSIVPLVDDMSLKVFPSGTLVKVTGYDSVCTVISSRFVPADDFTYLVFYTVSHIVDGVTRVSDFANMQVVKYVPPVDLSNIPDGLGSA